MNKPEYIYQCGRCGKQISAKNAEMCWWCKAPLCGKCWDQVGHCGHPEADRENERIRNWYASLVWTCQGCGQQLVDAIFRTAEKCPNCKGSMLNFEAAKS